MDNQCFLKYFDNWKITIANREGSFTASERANMFISRQTHKGLQITCLSLLEVAKYLLTTFMTHHAHPSYKN